MQQRPLHSKPPQHHGRAVQSTKTQRMTSRETMCVYRALAMRRKQDTDREERRRQEILARRRENIKAATEKYQRLNKNYQPKSDTG